MSWEQGDALRRKVRERQEFRAEIKSVSMAKEGIEAQTRLREDRERRERELRAERERQRLEQAQRAEAEKQHRGIGRTRSVRDGRQERER